MMLHYVQSFSINYIYFTPVQIDVALMEKEIIPSRY
uniref:Uncharacterized protein n=1 Tax=Rhizophora mucronata TaxID=61149 RepID=A0A2P2ND65_RHIMU